MRCVPGSRSEVSEVIRHDRAHPVRVLLHFDIQAEYDHGAAAKRVFHEAG